MLPTSRPPILQLSTPFVSGGHGYLTRCACAPGSQSNGVKPWQPPKPWSFPFREPRCLAASALTSGGIGACNPRPRLATGKLDRPNSCPLLVSCREPAHNPPTVTECRVGTSFLFVCNPNAPDRKEKAPCRTGSPLEVQSRPISYLVVQRLISNSTRPTSRC